MIVLGVGCLVVYAAHVSPALHNRVLFRYSHHGGVSVNIELYSANSRQTPKTA